MTESRDDEIERLKAEVARLSQPTSPKAGSPNIMDTRVGCLGAVAIVGGIIILGALMSKCQPDATPTANTAVPVASDNAPAEPIVPPGPSHHWSYREGQEYGYASVVSEDDQKAGQGAPTVTMWRYLGEHNGVYTVYSPEGAARITCTNPCEVLKYSGPLGTSRVAFNPETIGGGVMDDAINGQMEVYNRKGPAATNDTDQ